MSPVSLYPCADRVGVGGFSSSVAVCRRRPSQRRSSWVDAGGVEGVQGGGAYDLGLVPGQVEGEVALCRIPCTGGNEAMNRIAFPEWCAGGRDDERFLAVEGEDGLPSVHAFTRDHSAIDGREASYKILFLPSVFSCLVRSSMRPEDSTSASHPGDSKTATSRFVPTWPASVCGWDMTSGYATRQTGEPRKPRAISYC